MSQSDKPEAQQGPTDSAAWSRFQLSQALQDLARGEQTANALENNLSKLESKLDELLASFEETVGEVAPEKDPAARTDSAESSKSTEERRDDDEKDLTEKRTD